MPDPVKQDSVQPVPKNNLLDTVYKADPNQAPRKKTRLGDSTIEVNTNFGESKYDENFYPDAELNRDGKGMSLLETINENRAKNQSAGIKALAGLGRIVTKTGTEIAKMPGYIGGAVMAMGAEEGKGWDTFVNNAWVNSIENFNQEVLNDEMLPVYVKKAVKEGNLWDNMTSVDFWATEGADGVGFMASMFVPGAIFNAAKLGAKGASLLSKIGGKADDIAAFANKLGVNPSNIDLGLQTISNTMIEAAAEANSAGKSYDAKMTKLLESGAIGQEEFDTGRAQTMANVFKANLAILVGPNLVMSKALWGTKTAARTSLIDDLGQIAGAPTAKAGAKKVVDVAGRRAIDLVKASGREGFFEEGMQTTAEDYLVGRDIDLDPFSKKGLTDIKNTLLDVPEAYLDMIETTEGAKAIFLGSVLGGGMQMYSGFKQDQYDKKAQNAAIKALEKLDSFYKIYNEDVYNEEGDVDAAKMSERLQALGGLEVVSELYDAAHEKGDQDTIDGIHNFAVGELIKNFTFNPKLGMAALEEYLEKSTTLTDFADDRKQDVDAIREQVMTRAELLQKDQNTFQEFSRSFINLKDNGNKKEVEDFYATLNSKYVSLKNAEYHYKEKQQEYEAKAKDILEAIGAESMESPEALNNYGVQEALAQAEIYKANIKGLKNTINNFWKPEAHQERFDAYANFVQEEEAKQANSDRAEKVKTDIDNATTEEELDAVDLDFDEETNTYFEKIIQDKKENLNAEPPTDQSADEADAKWAEQAEESQQANYERDSADLQIQDLGNWIANNYNENEPINLSADQSPEYATNNAVITEITDDFVTLEAIDIDRIYKIPRTKKTPATPNVQEQYNTEGGKNHDQNIPKTNQNGNTDGKSGGLKLISYNKNTNTVLAGKAYRDFELTPEDKTGKEVSFKINLEGKSTNPDTDVFIQQALAAFKRNDFSNPELLIDYLPINAVFAEGIEGFLETKPVGEQREVTYANTARPMRTAIVNSIIAGSPVDALGTTVQGQNPGTLQVDTLTVNHEVKENSVLKLDFFNRMKSKEEKVKAIQQRIGYINHLGTFVALNGDKIELSKANSSGELYLMIPMANGTDFPLKLNVSRISDPDADVLMKLYEKRFENKEFGKNSRLTDVFDTAELNELKEQLAGPLSFFKKDFADITIKDVTDFFVWDKNLTGKAKIGFKEDKEGNRTFVFGNTEIKTPEQFKENKEAFREWLLTEKRHQINIKPKKGQDNNASISTSRDYLAYLLDNKIINTNAVIKDPTFQGFAEIFLDPVNLKGMDMILEVEEQEKPYDVSKIEAMLKKQKTVPVVPSEEVDTTAPTVTVNPKVAAIEKINAQKQAELNNLISEQELVKSIFPDSKIKQVVYHATDKKFDKFKIGKYSASIYFAPSKEEAWTQKGDIMVEAIINSKNPLIVKNDDFPENPKKNYDSSVREYTKEYLDSLPEEMRDHGEYFQEISVDKPEQIHILTEEEKSKINNKENRDKINAKYDALKNTTSADNIKAILDQVLENKTFVKLTPDQKKYKNSRTGKTYTRVTSYITPDRPAENNLMVQSSLAIGNKIDELVRDFFAGNLQDNYDVAEPEKIEAFIASLQKVKEKLDERGETVLANDIVLFDDELKIAGTVDLLTYDKQGNVRIYDMKTMRGNQLTRKYGNTVIYDSTKYTPISNREKHVAQLNLYRILLNNTHGIKAVQLGVMPIEVMYPEDVLTEETERLNLLPGIPVKIVDKVKDATISSKKLEKTPPKIRKSKKNFVSSHEVKNSEAAAKVSKAKESNRILAEQESGIQGMSEVEKQVLRDQQQALLPEADPDSMTVEEYDEIAAKVKQSAEWKRLDKLINGTTAKPSSNEITAEKLKIVANYLMKNKLLKMDAKFKTAMKGTMKQQFIYLQKQVENHELSVEQILKDCNK